MNTQIKKWGNSLGLRIPKVLAKELDLAEDSIVSITLEDGGLRIQRVPDRPTLDDLLGKITPENTHGEVDTGETQGDEAW